MDSHDPIQDVQPAALPLPPLPLETGAMYPAEYGLAFPPPPDFLNPASIRPARPRVWTVFLVLGLAFVAGIVAGGMVPVLMVVVENGGRFEDQQAFSDAIQAGILQPPILLTSGAATQAVLLVTALSAAILSPAGLVRRLRLVRSTLSPLGYLVAPVGALAVSFLFSSLVSLLHIHETGTLKLMGDAFKKLTPTELVFAIAIVGIAPGFAEEFLFRGYMQTRLAQRWGRWPAIWITAAGFGIMHLDLMQSPFAFAFGIYLGYLAEKSGSIRPTMLCHALNNSFMVWLGWKGGQNASEPSQSDAAMMAIVATVALLLCCLYIRYRVHPPASPKDPPTPPTRGFLPVISAPPSVAG